MEHIGLRELRQHASTPINKVRAGSSIAGVDLTAILDEQRSDR